MRPKRSRNTDLLKALGMGKESREFWDQEYARSPWQRQMHVSAAIQDYAPFRSRRWGGNLGYSRFQVTADGRSYTVLVLADDPVEWHLCGATSLRCMVHDRLQAVERHHLHILSTKEINEYHASIGLPPVR